MMKLIFSNLLVFVCACALAQKTPSLIPFRKGEKWGYSDSTKKMILPAVYKKAFPFSNGKALVQHAKGNFLQIDTAGKTILLLPYREGYYVREYGYIKTEGKDYKRGLVKADGKQVLPNLYDEIDVLGLDSFEVKRNGKKGTVNSKQKVLKAFVAYNMEEMNELMMMGRGKDLCPDPCLYAPYSEHMAVTAHKGLFGYADEDRHVAIACKYKMAGSFYYGCAEVLYEAPGQEHKDEVINGVHHVNAIILNEGFVDKHGTEYWED